MTCDVLAPESMPPLPAAVDVAAFRIAQEAMTNVARQAGARRVTVTIAVSDTLSLEIRDDGVGLAADHHVGVGLTSMRERADELGGSFEISSSAGGTTACVTLPLPPPA